MSRSCNNNDNDDDDDDDDDTNTIITRHRASTEHSLTFRVRTMLSYCEVEGSLLVGWLKFNVTFQHKYDGYT